MNRQFKLFYSAVLVAGLGLSSISYAAVPTDATIEEYFLVTEMDVVYERALGSLKKNLVEGALQTSKQNGDPLTEEKVIDAYKHILEEVANERFGWHRIRSDMVDLYKRTYTQEELEAYLNYSKSELGKSFNAKGPEMSAKLAEFPRRYVTEFMQNYQLMVSDKIREINDKKTNK